MNDSPPDWRAFVEQWSDERIHVEIDQALAPAADPKLDSEFRESALAASLMMALVLADRKNGEG